MSLLESKISPFFNKELNVVQYKATLKYSSYYFWKIEEVQDFNTIQEAKDWILLKQGVGIPQITTNTNTTTNFDFIMINSDTENNENDKHEFNENKLNENEFNENELNEINENKDENTKKSYKEILLEPIPQTVLDFEDYYNDDEIEEQYYFTKTNEIENNENKGKEKKIQNNDSDVEFAESKIRIKKHRKIVKRCRKTKRKK